MLLLVVGIILFLAVHLLRVIAPGLRRSMIDGMGETGFRIVYSILSLATLVLLVYGFGQARQETGVLYSPPAWMGHITLLLMLFAMICLAASLLPAGHIATRTKHPMVLSVKIWALAHLLINGETSSVLLFTAFLAWSVILRIALKRRERAGEAVVRPFVSARYDVYAVILGLVLYLALLFKLHEWLIGVSPLWVLQAAA